MTQVSVVAPDGGEAIQLGPIQMRILEDGKTTGHRLGVGEITIPPGTAGPPQHRHAQHDEGFYVVSGTARVTGGDTSYEAAAGTLVMVPPGAPHTFANPGQEPVVLLNTFTPDLYVRYFRDLRQMIADGQPLTPGGRPDAGGTAMTGTRPRTIELGPGRSVEVTLTEAGTGRTALVLHGGGGPATMQGVAAHLSGAMHVLTPVHPGWDGTGRPEWLTAIGDLAAAYLRLLRDEGHQDVLVIGSSIGGWIRAATAARHGGGVISGLSPI